MDLTTILGSIAGTFTTASLLPQVFKTLKTKNTRDISLLMYVFLTLGIVLWLIYGVMLNAMPIILANSTSLLLTASILILKIKHG
ncbi:MAG: SemiSWEET transporter [Pseudomonadota bacterium]